MQQLTANENLMNRLLGLEPPELIFDTRFNTAIAVEIQNSLHQLANAAQSAGFDLQVASHYRSFERQLLIWNEKAQGKRPVLDDFGQPIDLSRLTDEEKMFAILKWSSLPGASRHHWGTEVDVFDASRKPEGYKVQLTLEETQGQGVFADFHRWLTNYLQTNPNEFYRPYLPYVGAVAEEPWHLSFAPLSKPFSLLLDEERLRAHMENTDIELKPQILASLTTIFNNYLRPYQ